MPRVIPLVLSNAMVGGASVHVSAGAKKLNKNKMGGGEGVEERKIKDKTLRGNEAEDN